MVLELRPAHNPNETYGFVGVVTSLKDLSASVWMWHRDGSGRDGTWRINKVIEIPAEPASADDLPPLVKGFGAVPPLVTDINLSLDDAAEGARGESHGPAVHRDRAARGLSIRRTRRSRARTAAKLCRGNREGAAGNPLLHDERWCAARVRHDRQRTAVKASNWLTHLDFEWGSPIWRHWYTTLSLHHRLIRYDERGNGMSQRDVPDVSFDTWVRDLETVVDAAGLDRFRCSGFLAAVPSPLRTP